MRYSVLVVLMILLNLNGKTQVARHSRLQWDSILKATVTTDDAGFALLRADAAGFDSLFGNGSARKIELSIIYKAHIAPKFSQPLFKSDWRNIKRAVKPFGESGNEILLRAASVYYLGKGDTAIFFRYAKKYIKQFHAEIAAFEMNNWAWMLFQKVDKKHVLKTALQWSNWSLKDSIVNGQRVNISTFYDTNANLLYKLGKKTAAIAIEEKALTMARNFKDVAVEQDAVLALRKMKAGLITWK